MAFRCRSMSKPAMNVLKSAFNKPILKSTLPNVHPVRPSPTFSRSIGQRSLQSMLPLHSAVSSARLTTCLGEGNSRSICQGMPCSDPGV